MATVTARAYLSPTLVLLALDWPDGESKQDFLGFAIQRTPGFLDLQTGQLATSSWLPNRIGFSGPPASGKPDIDSKEAPIQKFIVKSSTWRSSSPVERPVTCAAFNVGTGRVGGAKDDEGHPYHSACQRTCPVHRIAWYGARGMGKKKLKRKRHLS